MGTLVIRQPFAGNLPGRMPAARQSSPASRGCARGVVALTLLWAGAFALLVALEWAIRSRGLADTTAAPLVLLVLMSAACWSASVCRRVSSLDRPAP
ncbi:hypothetical protein [Variovorax sp. OV329]|uniref:hypothetical protein n=1 Tax=Variovorax sp. OV329 TaxID=1882825 RepID=UPI0011137F1D|nr:hypothetical protein [Variovorax sp. OV329]